MQKCFAFEVPGRRVRLLDKKQPMKSIAVVWKYLWYGQAPG